jgi:hypothetical protein
MRTVFTRVNGAQQSASSVNLSGGTEKRKRNGARSCTVLVRSRENRAAGVEKISADADPAQVFNGSSTAFPQGTVRAGANASKTSRDGAK